MKILVTGGAGYIGSHTVVELVNAGYEPVILDNFSNTRKSVPSALNKITGKEIPVEEGDCRDEKFLEQVFSKYTFDAVIHFAASIYVSESVKNPILYYENNINSLVTMLKTSVKFGAMKMIFSSSCTVYGQPDTMPVTEETPRKDALSPYGNTKRICEDILTDYTKANPGYKSVILRYFNPIGAHSSGLIGEWPHTTDNHIVPYITQVATGKQKELVIFGNDYNTPDGTCIRDYIHVTDLAKAHVSALKFVVNTKKENKNLHIFNVGTGQGNSVLEVLSAFEKAIGKQIPHKFGPRRAGDVEQVWADNKKAVSDLGWKPVLSLETAMKNAYGWEDTQRINIE